MAPLTLRRTATVAWSPALPHIPGFPQYIATASVAGALDASFSSQSQLELFSLSAVSSDNELPKVGGLASSARFNRIAWSNITTDSSPNGILAGGLENGELSLFNPYILLNSDTAAQGSDPTIFHSQSHSSALRGLDFNPIQCHLLATGAGEGEILIWDLNNPSTPYSPGATKTPRLSGSEINVLAWNRCVPHILATSSSNGVTVVWDLKNRREVFSLNAPTSSASSAMWNGTGGNSGGLGPGARRQGVVVAWHPDVPLQLITALEDDSNPAIFLWDLRNAHAPLRTLSGHSKGILSVAWCPKDSDLLLSCGKDNRTLCWNPSTGDVLGELPHAENWCFDVQWCSRNPNWISVASFDGTVAVQQLLPTDTTTSPPTSSNGQDNPFDVIASPHATHSAISLRQPPKWLRRPCSAAFAWGNRLIQVTSSNRHVRVHHLPSMPAKAAHELTSATRSGALSDLAKSRAMSMPNSDKRKKMTWLALHAQFDGVSGRKLLVEHLDMLMETTEPPLNSSPSMNPPSSAPNALVTVNENEIIAAVIHGNYKEAVSIALAQGRFADAFVLSACGGHDLFIETRDSYLKQHNSGLSALLKCITHNEWKSVVENHNLDWRHSMIALLTYAHGEDLTSRIAELGDSLISVTGNGIPDRDLGILSCNILAGRTERMVTDWVKNLHSAHLASPVQQQTMIWGQKCLERAQMLHELVEQVTVLLHALHGDPSPENISLGLQRAFAEYSFAMSLHGALFSSWSYLAFVSDTGDPHISALRDRIYHSLDKADQPATAPARPFDVVSFPMPTSVPPQSHGPSLSHKSTQPQHPVAFPPTIPTTGQSSGYSYPVQPPMPQNPYAAVPSPSVTTPAYSGASAYSATHHSPAIMSNPIQNMNTNPSGPLSSFSSMNTALPSSTGMTGVPPAPQRSQGGWNDAPPMAPPTVMPRPPAQKAPTPAPSNIPTPYSAQPYTSPPTYPNPLTHLNSPVPILQPNVVSSAPLPPPPMTVSPPMNNQMHFSAPNSSNPHPGTNPANVSAPVSVPVSASQAVFVPTNPYASTNDSSGLTNMVNPPPNAQNATLSKQPAMVPSSSSPAHPPGDRSHIPSDQQPLARSLMAAQGHIKQVHGASTQRRIAEDVDRRLNQLLDALNNGTIDTNIISVLQSFANAVDARDWATACRIQQELAMSNFDPWMLGLKRLVDLLARS